MAGDWLWGLDSGATCCEDSREPGLDFAGGGAEPDQGRAIDAGLGKGWNGAGACIWPGLDMKLRSNWMYVTY